MLIYLQLFKESFNFAIKALRDNKLRTFLSLLGVTVGIFSIISVLAAVDSLDRNIRENLSGLDKNVMYLTKYSFGPTDVPRWQRLNFPQVSYQEYDFISRNTPDAEAVAYSIFGVNESIKYEGKTIASVSAEAASSAIEAINDVKIANGRFYTEAESNAGSPVMVLGHDIAEQLFGTENPVGKEVRFYGRKLTVIGVLKKYGMGNDTDEKIFLPPNFLRRFMNSGPQGVPSGIIIKPKRNVNGNDFEQTLTQLIRRYRGLKPGEPNNFFINKISSFTDMIDSTIRMLNLVGWVIGGFSILVGGFGIANIMFVSVKERTNLIGIQKSLGAKNQFILFQFLFEAVLLALIGGVIGIFFVWIATLVASGVTDDFNFVLSVGNIAVGAGVSVAIGLVSGILPAVSASRLNPVEAIRTGM
ncbi:MAG: ABC transporter permease [Capnocytophaga sp.]|nr:ABC transporter permease [Capnocytophaga sp.]